MKKKTPKAPPEPPKAKRPIAVGDFVTFVGPDNHSRYVGTVTELLSNAESVVFGAKVQCVQPGSSFRSVLGGGPVRCTLPSVADWLVDLDHVTRLRAEAP